ncbi:MAG: hypothetical protein KDD11_03905 [Acidobacteria bacterium]|nr:hypothetical protein [Acidobacteriota bacterium]
MSRNRQSPDRLAAERLRDIDVLDVDGRSVRLGGLWHERPAVLVFVRHYG